MKVQQPDCWFFCGRCKPIQPAQTALQTPQPQSHQQGSYVLQSHLWRNERMQHWDTRFSIITKLKMQEASLCNKSNEWWHKMRNDSYPLNHEMEHVLSIFIKDICKGFMNFQYMVCFHQTNELFIRGIDLAGLLPVGWIIEEVVGFATAVKIEKRKNVFRSIMN